ncbi:hypothetical protein AAEY27_08260 [Kosakonia sp. BYX6]|uniref:Oligosaccharide repeat unit polymerase n=1 Tax=Kosakonia calanthes TaxID=3139408 RepID=A0ABZ3BAA3_9ENTR
MIFLYYFLWFGLAPIFARRYQETAFDSDIVYQAYLYLASSYTVLMLVAMMVEYTSETRSNFHLSSFSNIQVAQSKLLLMACVIIISFVLYIQMTGGVTHWQQNLDRAFLTRQGAGTWYLIFSLILPLFVFFIRLKYRGIFVLLSLMIVVLALSPFIGSKQKIIHYFLLIFATWIFCRKFNIRIALSVFMPAALLFVLGNYFRNASWMTLNDVLGYSLNYFDTLDSLLLVIKEKHYPLEVFSFFLPFNKFANLFTGQDAFFDISAYLTNMYFPTAWNIRATVQFPVEVDLFFSFGYWLGLIPLAVFIFVYSKIYVRMLYSNKVIYLFIWFNLFIYLMSHLRGGLILWTDFYMYPYLIIVYFMFKEVKYNVVPWTTKPI